MTSLPPQIEATRVKRKRKEKKQAIEISLWINKTKYEFGLLCTFCAKKTAVCHCPLCTDFYCETCDVNAHNTKKRKDHVRNPLSKLDLNAAAHIVIRTVRRVGHLRILQELCREKFRRRFDRKSLNYYYVNTVYGSVSWRKPYCLRQQELFPFMTPPYAASKCQNLYHLWKAREKVRRELMSQYRKIFDRSSGRFYYTFNGKSQLISRSSWKKPFFLGKRSFPRDLKSMFSIDTAAIIIQRKWRTLLMWNFLRALARATYDEIWDPVKGRYNYFNRDSEHLLADKPKILRHEPWDPNRVPEWSIDRVAIFLRRIGLKKYVDTMRMYEVDGNALMLLDFEDFDNMNITNRLHIKKIRVELDKIYTAHQNLAMSEEHFVRREKIRRNKMFIAAAVLIQRQFRRFAAKKVSHFLRELQRLREAEAKLNKKIEASGAWWTEDKSLFCKKSDSLNTMLSSSGLKLPPIKSFGRRQDYLSAKGWGRRGDDPEGKWIPLPASLSEKSFMGDQHPSLIFTEKLRVSGYDKKRMKEIQDAEF